ncbi:MAG: hypothetical protein FWD12_02615 [Alphaproteobacteria bacterium]|nr:hypothetical protein [Alphaproteobacteria bacterium]
MTASEDEFERTARRFDSPDFVEVVIHSYRHRQRAAAGDPAFEAIERERPSISVLTVVLYGVCEGVEPPNRPPGAKGMVRRSSGPTGDGSFREEVTFCRVKREPVIAALRELLHTTPE